MEVTSAKLPESRRTEQPKRAEQPHRAIEIGNPQNGNSSLALLNEGAFSAKAAALTTNNGVHRVLSEVLGAKAGESPGRVDHRTHLASGPANSVSFQERDTPGDPASQYRSQTPVPLEGYDSAKLNDPSHNTPKYIFGRVAQNFQLDSVQGDKARAEDLLWAMVPELRANGLEVVDVQGDRIQVKTEIGYEWVDVVRGAGSENPGWWWGSEGKGTAQPTATVQEWAAATGQTDSGAPTGQAGAGGVAGAGGSSGNRAAAGVLGSTIDQAAVMAILQKYPPTNEGIRQALPELQRSFPGVQILEHPERLDKLQFPNGAVVDVVVAAGGPDPKWGWMPEN